MTRCNDPTCYCDYEEQPVLLELDPTHIHVYPAQAHPGCR